MARTVIVAHGHPKFTFGGGEIAAYRHFEYMRAQGEDVFFLGSIRREQNDRHFGPNEHLLKVGERDFLLRTVPMNPYLLNFADVADENRHVETLLEFDADIYHFHHIWNVGARTIQRLMQAKPEAKFVLTLHEFLMICANHGQMVKSRTNELCYRADPYACASCLPQHRPTAFFLRRQRLLRLLRKFDLIISPSEFLRSRYQEWGLAGDLIKVIENGMPDFDEEGIDGSETKIDHRVGRFAFFGQPTPTKGLDVLIKAAVELARRGARGINIDILGGTLDQFQSTYPQIDVPEALVRFVGPYQPKDVVRRMRRYGWIVVPSIWWENSPLVIQEAKLASTPVIAANIGGMREKVSGWGELFEVGDPHSLAEVIEECAGNVERYNLLRGRIDRATGVGTFHRIWAQLVDAIPPRSRPDPDSVAIGFVAPQLVGQDVTT